MASRAFSSSSSTLPCTIRVSALGAATGASAVAAACSPALAGALGGVFARGAGAGAVVLPPPLKYQPTPPTSARTVTPAATNTSNGGLLPRPRLSLTAAGCGSKVSTLSSERSEDNGFAAGGAGAHLATAAASAPSTTACVLRGSSGIGSTANTLLPPSEVPSCFSAAPAANTSTPRRA